MRKFLTLHNPSNARRWYEQGLWRNDTYYTLAAGHAAVRPDAFAVRDAARRLTWKTLLRWVDVIADDFHEKGLLPGDVVSLWLPNRVEAVAIYLACSRNGYVCNPALHRNFTQATVFELLRRLRSKILVLEEGYGDSAGVDQAAVKAAGLETLEAVIRLPSTREPGADLPDLDAMPAGLAPIDRDPDRVANLSLTSGTTGIPKGVLHTENTILANARDLVADWGHGPQTILCCLSPLCHNICWIAEGQCLVAGSELVLNDPPVGVSLLDWIVATQATYVMGVPTHAIDILQEQKTLGLARLGNVKIFYMAGAAIPRVTAEAFLAQGITPQNCYGMSENLSHHYTRPGDSLETILTTVGRSGPGYESKIFKQDNPDEPAEIGEIGEIGGRGACLMLGYYADQLATDLGFNRDGWFMSGDLGRMSADGNLQIVGRAKDMIIRGGHNIYPASIEDMAIKYPGIVKAAAFGLPDDRLGERICLAVVSAHSSPGPLEMVEHLRREGLSKYYLPEFFISLEEIPMTANGKILKRQLVEMVRSGKIKPVAVDRPGGDIK